MSSATILAESVQCRAAPTTSRSFTVVRIALACLLLIAAGLKLTGLNVTALPRVGWFSTPQVQVLAAEWELVLGVWLLSGAYRFAAWIASLGTFAIFAAVSAYFGWIGVSSCGCFGAIEASPWLPFGVDVAALITLSLIRPKIDAALSFRPACSPANLAAFAFAAIGVALCINSTSLVHVLTRPVEPLTASPSFLDFGNGSAYKTTEQSLQVRNSSEHPIRIIGGTATRTCSAITDLPVTVLPGQSTSIRIRFSFPKEPGFVTRTVKLWTNSDTQPVISFLVGGRVSD